MGIDPERAARFGFASSPWDTDTPSAEAEVTEGYRDGGDPDTPKPGPNRSEAYRHGFANRCDDLRGQPRAPAAVLRAKADTISTDTGDRIAGGMWRAWTDGSCVRSQNGPGGWAAILIGPAGQRRELSGSEPRTTNNKMELAAILAAVRDIPKNATATIYTDSLLSVNILTRKWKAKKNRDLVQAIRRAAENRHVKFQWIRGHNGHVLNERADQLANAARLHQRR